MRLGAETCSVTSPSSRNVVCRRSPGLQLAVLLAAACGAAGLVVRPGNLGAPSIPEARAATAPAAAAAAADSRNATAIAVAEQTPPARCAEEGGFEGSLDELSWAAFAGELPPLWKSRDGPQPQIPSSPRLLNATRGGAGHAYSAADSRLAHWWEATDRLRANATAPHPSAAIDRRPAGRARVLPPACPGDIPASDPYWSQSDSYTIEKDGQKIIYNDCRYSNGCTKQFMNWQRFTSIRSTLWVTKSFLERMNVQYVLYGGSAIGAYRCGDVLPWDVDGDVLIRQEEVPRLLALIKSKTTGLGTGWMGVGHAMDLAAFGMAGFSIMEKFPGCMPFVIVDRSTGFFVDVFPMRPDGEHVHMPWWHGKADCDVAAEFPPCNNGGKCNSFVKEDILPPSTCHLGTEHNFSCPARLEPWLTGIFGQEVDKPNVIVRPAANKTVSN